MVYVILAVPLLIGLFLAYHALGLGAGNFEIDPSDIERCRVSPRNWSLLNREERAEYRRKLAEDFSFTWRVCRMMAPLMDESHKGWPLIRMWFEFQVAYLKLSFFRPEGETLIQAMTDVHTSVFDAVSAGFTESAAGA